MTNEQRIKNLSVPQGRVDVVLDTDAYNEIDDQFAISYLLKSKEKLNTKAIYAAPFFNSNSKSPKDGMEKSYDEIFRLLSLLGEEIDVFKGSERYLDNENTPVISPAARDLAERVKNYSPQNPLYIVAIGAITNIASAILLNPELAENSVVIWLGGHALHYDHTREFNMYQDVAAARVVMKSGVPFIQLPCRGVVSSFTVSKPELEFWLKGKNALADYLAENTIKAADSYAKATAWTRVIWDVTAVAWLLNDSDKFMESRIIPAHIPTYDNLYAKDYNGCPMRYVYNIKTRRSDDRFVSKINGIETAFGLKLSNTGIKPFDYSAKSTGSIWILSIFLITEKDRLGVSEARYLLGISASASRAKVPAESRFISLTFFNFMIYFSWEIVL